MIRKQPEGDFKLKVDNVVTSIWIVSSSFISFHDLTWFRTSPVRFAVCRVSSTWVPGGGVIMSVPDCAYLAGESAHLQALLHYLSGQDDLVVGQP